MCNLFARGFIYYSKTNNYRRYYMSTKLAYTLTVGGIVTGIAIGGGIVPIVLLSSGLAITVAEIINILNK